MVWTRVGAPPAAAGGPVRSTPLVLLPRRSGALAFAAPAAGRPNYRRALPGAGSPAARRRHVLRRAAHDARMLPVELENTLGELVATGLVNADSYAGLRAMLLPASKRASNDKRRRGAGPTMEEAGRWALVRRARSPSRSA
jgi:ATP-dependent Lhr-like helicase